MKKRYRAMSAVIPTLALAISPLVGQTAFAAGGDFSLDFTAAAPLSYDPHHGRRGVQPAHGRTG